jgi:ubiquinone/menaquinone biosynthesis C-methylase UbiE
MGIDRSLDMISQAQRNGGTGPNPRYLRMDAGQMSFPDGHFDLVTAVQSAHHWTDPNAVFAEVHRVLKPGGRFLVLEANRDASAVPEGWIHRVAGWPPDALVRLGWRRFGMDASEWTALTAHATQSPFDRWQSGCLGFYQLLEVHR